MKKLTLLIAMCFTITAFSYAQDNATNTNTTAPAHIKRCGTAEAYASQMANDPVFRAQREETEKRVDKWIAEHPNYEPKTTYTIPTVVHVLYTSTSDAAYISVAQVQSQINATNADWGGTNTHSMHTFSSSLKANQAFSSALLQKTQVGMLLMVLTIIKPPLLVSILPVQV